MAGFGDARRAAEARGDEVAQSAPSVRARVVRAVGFSEASADGLATAFRAWCTNAEFNSEREIMDAQYRVDGGVHHLLVLFSV